jgi:hypothetical protein
VKANKGDRAGMYCREPESDGRWTTGDAMSGVNHTRRNRMEGPAALSSREERAIRQERP